MIQGFASWAGESPDDQGAYSMVNSQLETTWFLEAAAEAHNERKRKAEKAATKRKRKSIKKEQ